MMNFVGASLKKCEKWHFFVAFHKARKSYYIDMNNMKKYSEKILPASHGLLKNPDGYVIIMLMSIF